MVMECMVSHRIRSRSIVMANSPSVLDLIHTESDLGE